jgi:predicted SnoaL-like aldol condensation-catalyzing enzyme
VGLKLIQGKFQKKRPNATKVVVWKTLEQPGHGALRGNYRPEFGLNFDAVDIFRIQDGLIAEHWDVADTYSLFSQLGKIK